MCTSRNAAICAWLRYGSPDLSRSGSPPASAQMLRQRPAGIHARFRLPDLRPDLAERCRAAEERRGEPDAFFRSDPHDRDVAPRLESGSLQRLDRDQPGDYPRRAVEIASIPDGIEVRSDDDPGSSVIAAGHGDVSVGSGIMIDEETEIARSLRQQAMREVFSFPIGVAANAASFGRTLAQASNRDAANVFCSRTASAMATAASSLGRWLSTLEVMLNSIALVTGIGRLGSLFTRKFYLHLSATGWEPV